MLGIGFLPIPGTMASLITVIIYYIFYNYLNIIFFIDIELKNPIVNILFNKFFNYGFEKILNSFEQRAKETIKF